MKIAAFVAVAMAGTAVSGCATIVKGSGQDISVNSTPDGAACELHNSQGIWTLTTPGTVHVDKSKSDISLTCDKAGYLGTNNIVPSRFQFWTMGNILIGGVLGLCIDAATGSMHEYPHNITVRMIRERSAATPDSRPLSTPSVLPPEDMGAPSS